ncbi:hydrolase, partial [Streptomyces sp. NPDC058794]
MTEQNGQTRQAATETGQARRTWKRAVGAAAVTAAALSVTVTPADAAPGVSAPAEQPAAAA